MCTQGALSTYSPLDLFSCALMKQLPLPKVDTSFLRQFMQLSFTLRQPFSRNQSIHWLHSNCQANSFWVSFSHFPLSSLVIIFLRWFACSPSLSAPGQLVFSAVIVHSLAVHSFRLSLALAYFHGQCYWTLHLHYLSCPALLMLNIFFWFASNT